MTGGGKVSIQAILESASELPKFMPKMVQFVHSSHSINIYGSKFQWDRFQMNTGEKLSNN